MKFRTEVNIDKPSFSIRPLARMLFVGSCFADNIGRRFQEEKFRAVVNPYGVMYNPVSILHTVRRFTAEVKNSQSITPTLANSVPVLSPWGDKRGALLSWGDKRGALVDYRAIAVFTLGTNHVYRLKETGEIVDNCRKRPQRLFQEEELTIDKCCESLSEAVDVLMEICPDIKVIVTVSPIRYAKYGFHGSQLSKATLLLAADKLCSEKENCIYFPAYEIVNDELRDYRFYKEDMLHPSEQAVNYIWERFSETFFDDSTFEFLEKWRPIKEALGHKPFNPDGEEYKLFMKRTHEKMMKLKEEYPELEV